MGFLRTLFDLSFDSYVTVRIARWIFVGVIVLAVFLLLGGVLGGLMVALDAGNSITPDSSLYELRKASERRAMGLVVLALSPVGALLTIVIGRVMTEMTVVLFSIAESLSSRGTRPPMQL